MTEEKALNIYARCFNARDFADVVRLLHRKATFEAYNRFYRCEGAESVARFLEEKAAELRAQPKPGRAYAGFMMVRHDIAGLRAESCVVLTQYEPWNVEGVVRIKCTPLHIKGIRVLDPAKCQFTRGDYAGTEDV
jgi:hypothetical protein